MPSLEEGHVGRVRPEPSVLRADQDHAAVSADVWEVLPKQILTLVGREVLKDVCHQKRVKALRLGVFGD